MQTALKVISLIAGTVVCVLILMQGGQTTGLSGMFDSKSNLSLFSSSKARGTDLLIGRMTALAAAVFLAAAVIWRYI